MMVKVVAAFFDSLGLKMGTPFEMASVPLMATAPAEKARNINHKVTGSSTGKMGGGVTGVRVCVKTLMIPITSIIEKLMMKR
jgi:hypothetical protein